MESDDNFFESDEEVIAEALEETTESLFDDDDFDVQSDESIE